MEEKDKLTKEIAQLIGNIKTNYPEVYRNLEEVPIKITSKPHEDLKVEELRDYLETLKIHLRNHLELHQQTEPLSKDENS